MARLAAIALGAAALAVGSVHARRARKYNTSAKRIDAPGVLNVHVVAHTHDDVGWLKTVDEYYTGANNSIQHASVREILDTTTAALQANPDRKFVYVEQAFFQRWWREQDAESQAAVQQLVAEGRLSFLNGGWCMHDEATTVYSDMVDQTTLGHREIVSEFGTAAVPRVTWQIDPFGHSGTQGSLLSSPIAGFEAVYVSRADYNEIQQRTANKTLEYLWQPSASLGAAGTTLYGMLNSGLHLYFPLPGLCWDAINCNDPIIQDDAALDDYNVQDRVNFFVDSFRGQQANYVGGDVMITQGFDFNFEAAHEWYDQLDKMIHYVNLNTSIHGVNMFYSTPYEYTQAKLSYPMAWPTTAGSDGMPYADCPHCYWSGYFTSRAALKGYVRDTSALFQAVKQAQAFAGGAPSMNETANPLVLLEKAMGVAQHHDAVAGTEQQHVAFNYAKRLANGRTAAVEGVFAPALANLTGFTDAPFVLCDLANATICSVTEAPASTTAVLLYNSQGQAKAALGVRVPVALGAGVTSFSVTAPDGKTAVTAQLLPLSAEDAFLRDGYYNYTSPQAPTAAMRWLAWQADVPASGYAVYFLAPVSRAADAPHTHASTVTRLAVGSGDQTLSNGVVTLTISAATGMLSSYANAQTGITTPLAQSWGWYNASQAGFEANGQASGAYIFRPNGTGVMPLSPAPAVVDIVTGPVVSEARQTIAPGWASQVLRLWAGVGYVDAEFTVGPVPIADGQGKEIITRWTTPFATQGNVQTDSNGREMYTRVRNERPAYTYNATYEPIASNYYPVNTQIAITHHNASTGTSGPTLWVVTDRTQGGGSMADGSVELMVHRRLTADDQRGVNEPLSEPGITWGCPGLVVRGLHRFGVDAADSAAQARRSAAQDVSLFRPITAFAPSAGVPPASWPLAMHPTYSGLAAPLPANVHLLTVHSWGPQQLLVRLAHIYAVGEDAALSGNVTVQLGSLFAGVTLLDATEMTLPASLPLASVPQRRYESALPGHSATLPLLDDVAALGEGETEEAAARKAAWREVGMPVTLSAMAVRTFMCTTA